MENSIGELFLKLVSNYGFFSAIIIITVVLVLFYGCINLFQFLHKKILNKFENRKKIKLNKHQFFDDLKYLKEHKLKEVNTSCIIRRQLYIDIMKIRIDCFYNSFNNFIKQDLNSFNNKQFFNRVRGIIDDANSAAITNALSQGIPIFILNSMIEKRKTISQFNNNAIKGYCYNNYLYSDNIQRMCAILDFMTTSIECYMNVLEENLAEFNGNIKKMNYKGTGCSQCHFCVHDKYLEDLKNQIKQQNEKYINNE